MHHPGDDAFKEGNHHEERLTRLEETRQPALEVAQEEDEKKKESSEDAQEVIATRYHTQGGIG